MRVLQIIDSLNPGGAENMAVNYANALQSYIDVSYLCSTREVGALKENISDNVEFFFLNKKLTFDIFAIYRLGEYIKRNKIEIIHAHSSSYFFPVVLKCLGFKFKLIWHDHYGESNFLKDRRCFFLFFFSYYFDGIIAVNSLLKEWALEKLNCKNVVELNNFSSIRVSEKKSNRKYLKGIEGSFKIICVANLRPQKDHFNLLKAFEIFAMNKPCSLHLIGEDPNTLYSKSILNYIDNSFAKDKIFYYGLRTDIDNFLKEATIGILSSRSEGLPLVLLEYGMNNLPVICTNVGKCKEVVGSYALIVEPNNTKEVVKALNYYYDYPKISRDHAKNFNEKVISNFTEKSLMEKVNIFYKNL